MKNPFSQSGFTSNTSFFLFTPSKDFIVGTFSDAIPKPLIFLSNSLLCFFQSDKKPCLPLKLITFRISSCIIWCIWCKSRLREWVLQSDCLLNYNLYYWISQSDQKKQRTNFHFKVRHFFLRYWIIKVFIQSIKLGHKDITTTLNIYTDVTKELKRTEFDGLDKYFNNSIA